MHDRPSCTEVREREDAALERRARNDELRRLISQATVSGGVVWLEASSVYRRLAELS